MEDPRCEHCGKALENSMCTHCSEKCLFDSIKASQPFVANDSIDQSITDNE